MSKMCESCLYYDYDEEGEVYECIMNLDEDEYYHYITGKFSSCPYFRYDNEYKIVNKHI
ncbi:MAG: DUF6472 family protein [Clostridiales bacterium]|nr:DUF6472 family protein [Clostridiales bacterium]